MQRRRMPGLLLGMTDGGLLERRIRTLLDWRLPWARRRRFASSVACLVVLISASETLGLFAVRASVAQDANTDASTKVQFEVSSIKPTKDSAGDSGSIFSRNEYNATNRTLLDLVRAAYGITGSGDRVSGGAGWISSTRFDIKAKLSESDIENLQKLDRDGQQERMKLLLQSLLADRFKLKVHHETKELPVYLLMLAKGGPKFAASVSSASQTQHGVRAGRGQIFGMDTKLDTFVRVLAMQAEIGRTVLDKTGLTGSYDLTLKWTPESRPGGENAAPPDAGPSLFTALQEQLGLRLEAGKAPEDVIVIDSAEMPAEN